MSRSKIDATEPMCADAFFAGYCCALSAYGCQDDGISANYVAAVRAVGAMDLLNYARRKKDMELPKIRRAVRELKKSGDPR